MSGMGAAELTYRETRASSSWVSWIYEAGGLGASGGGAGGGEKVGNEGEGLEGPAGVPFVYPLTCV